VRRVASYTKGQYKGILLQNPPTVELRGIEPLTSPMRTVRSPS
jgi:hypothetical protein